MWTIAGAWIEGRTIIRDLSRSSEVKEILVADLQEGEANRAHQYISELDEREDRCKSSQKAERKSAMRYSSCFENMNVACACGEIIFTEKNQPIDYTFVFANEAFEKLLGLDNIVGKRASEVMPELDESLPDLVKVYTKVAFGGPSIRRELCSESLGKCFLSSIYSLKNSFVNSNHDSGLILNVINTFINTDTTLMQFSNINLHFYILDRWRTYNAVVCPNP